MAKEEDSLLLSDDDYISAAEAASLLGIHTASIRNWIRHGYIYPVNNSVQKIFRKSEVEELKHNIESGRIGRLNRRANKSGARKTFIPDEYSGNQQISTAVQLIADHLVSGHLEIPISMFFLTLNVIKKNGLADITFLENPDTLKIESSNPYLQEELSDWMQSLPVSSRYSLYKDLLNTKIPIEEDILGLLYQSVLAEGRKAKMGSYYTPRKVVDSIIQDYYRPEFRFLDPCCGTGRFLLCAAAVSDNPENIVGFDIDELAVRIARINLIFRCKERHFRPQVFCYDTLNRLPEHYNNSFDVIASNPPWGMHLSTGESRSLKLKYPEITSGESFSYFIRRGYDLLREGGALSFILPEAILNVKTHKDIRKFILDNSRINSVYLFKRMFKNVFTKVVRLDIMKELPQRDCQITINQDSNSFYSSQKTLYDNPDHIFSFHPDENSRKILQKAYELKHTFLKNQAEWALGIVTGDNKKFLSSTNSEGYEEVYTGKEVDKFKLKKAQNYIKFLPQRFQQCAPVEKYRAKEKLIYRFISKSPVLAYDDKQRLTLNSANILIPRVPDYPIKSILALFNSSLYQFIFKQKFNSIKVLRAHLEELPLPIWNNEIHKKICAFADLIFSGEDANEHLDEYISEQFKLSKDEIEYIKKINSQ